MLILALLLISRLLFLQIINHDKYTTLSQQNSVDLIPLPPKRGLIYDRNGVVIADNQPIYSLTLNPSKIADLNRTIDELTKLITITKTERDNFMSDIKRSSRYDDIPLKLRLTEQDVAKFYSNQHLFPGVSIKAQLLRYYPNGTEFAHVLGYVGRINSEDLKKVDKKNYRSTNFIGKTGIEEFYEDQLHGQVGHQEVEVNANGQAIRTLKRTPPKAGDDLYLTLDAGLQKAVYESMKDEKGSAVVVDTKTGQILAMVSTPSFDPNLFVTGISYKDYGKLQNDPAKPLFNRSIRGLFAPGSTIKPIVGLAGLENHIITAKETITDPGYFKFPQHSHRYRDTKSHGIVDLNKAIVVSCDTYFYQLGDKMGINSIKHMLNRFGLGQITGIDLNNELSGLVPSPNWKRQNKDEPWYPGDTVISSIGQGFMLSTPLQLAMATMTIANKGQRFQPNLLLASENKNQLLHTAPSPLRSVELQDEHNWQVIIDAMQGVITQGTAHRFGRDTPYSAAGKTGTTQHFTIKQNEHYDASKLPEHLRDTYLFVGFAPVETPEIAIAVITEHTRQAPPVARQIMDYYFQHHDAILATTLGKNKKT